MIDNYSGIDLPTAGKHLLEGAEALAFLRARHGVGDGSDLGRISSQQVYLSALVRKMEDSGTLSNPLTVYKIATAATSNMQLSSSLDSVPTMISIASTLKNIPPSHVVFVQYPGYDGWPGIFSGKVQPNTGSRQPTVLAHQRRPAIHARYSGPKPRFGGCDRHVDDFAESTPPSPVRDGSQRSLSVSRPRR